MESWPAHWLIIQGILADFADTDTRLFTAAFYGLQFDFVVNNQPEEASKAFDLMMLVFFNNLDRRLATGGQHI
ncbi:hypothetical protein [Pseudarthrobacter sp. S9]|uniref:hypothetical protein n=1 Tax=Pseudarthrobacter sp. S9 TaxID=3418421 RepID=UPI003D021116